jgi:hypothetical protein
MTVQLMDPPTEACDRLPGRRPSWADLPPGPDLAAALAEAEQHGMDDFELAEAMAAYQRLSSWAEARQMDTIVMLSNRRRRGPAAKVLKGTPDCSEFVPVEVGLILGLTDYSATALTKRAHALAYRLPATFAALEAGDVDMRKVLIVLEKTQHLSDELCARLEAVIVPQAMVQTTAELRDTVDREIAIADPNTAEKRRKDAVAQRRLARHATDHGTSGLYLLDAPPELTAAIYHRATAVARAMKSGGDRCPMGVLRADVVTAWGLGADPVVLHECDQGRSRHSEPAPAEPDHGCEDATGSPPDPDDAAVDLPPDLPDPSSLPDLPPPPEPPEDWDDTDPAADDVGSESGDAGAGCPPVPPSGFDTPGFSAPGFGVAGGFGAVGGINLTIPLETARGRAHHPGELDGYGPILPVPARRLLRKTVTQPVRWTWTVVNDDGHAIYHGVTSHRPTSPDEWDALLRDVRDQLAACADELDVTGCSVEHPPPGEPNTTRYRFPAAARVMIGIRDRTCRNPTCRRSARLCDTDHVIPHDQHGPTCACNGGPECRRHHRTKQQPGWHLAQRSPGYFVLTAPNGHQYVIEPDAYPT